MGFRGWLLLFFAWVSCRPLCAAIAQDSDDRWLSGREQSQIRWTPSVSPPGLSRYQRLWARLSIRVDGDEVVKRGKKGVFVAIIDVRDSAGKRYGLRKQIDLEDFAQTSSSHELEYATDVFLLPDTYQVSLAVIEPATEKYSLARRTLRVPPLNNDPLPDAWRDLPRVEFVTVPDPPDRWFLPEAPARLHLPVENRRPARIEILANTATSENTHRPRRLFDATMDGLLPSLKVLSQVELGNGSINVTVLDVARHQVSFRQNDVHELSWPALKAALEEDNPNMIDAEALKHRDQSAQFFVDEVTRRIAPSPAVRIAIVLSASMAFSSGQDLRPITLAPDPDLHLYYIRFQTIHVRPGSAAPAGPVPRGRGTTFQLPAPTPFAEDQLERTLKPLQPRLFDVGTPAEFRKALATILREIGQL